MRIEFIGHAGFVVEGASETLIMDPWLSDTGAFDSSWFQFPCNHHLDREVIGRLRSADRPCYLYISHEHKDHLDQPFLERLVEYQPTLIVAAFQEQHFINSLRALGFARIIVAEDGQPVQANTLRVKLFIDDSGMNRNSAILVKEADFSFLNLNDCKIYDRLHQIRQANGPINVLACQFSGASWHPTCYAYSPEEYARIATQKRFSKFRSVLQAIETVSPDWYFPSAGPPCFLDPDLLHLNFERVNIFPQQSAIIDYLRRRKAPCKTEALMPGDVFNSTVKRFTRQAPQLVTPGSEEAYIRQYAAKFSHLWDAQKRVRSTEACKVILGRLEGELAESFRFFRPRTFAVAISFSACAGLSVNMSVSTSRGARFSGPLRCRTTGSIMLRHRHGRWSASSTTPSPGRTSALLFALGFRAPPIFTTR